MGAEKGVDAVDRALTIVECFGPQRARLSLAELAAETGYYKSTILRLAASLIRFGYLVRDDGGAFRLGPSAWRIGAAYRSGFRLSDVLRPELKRLSERTNETASYYVREGDARICLFRAEPDRSIRHSIDEGTQMPLALGASGKVLGAWSADPPPGAETIRTCGHAVSLGERDPEVAAVAVPLLTQDGTLLGAVAVSGLVTRFAEARIPDLVAALHETRSRLTDRLSG